MLSPKVEEVSTVLTTPLPLSTYRRWLSERAINQSGPLNEPLTVREDRPAVLNTSVVLSAWFGPASFWALGDSAMASGSFPTGMVATRLLALLLTTWIDGTTTLVVGS